MSDKRKIRVIRREPGTEDITAYIKLEITDKLSEIRKQLSYNSTIRMDDTLLFSDRENSNIITPDRESERSLEDIISMENIIYLKNCDTPDSEYFKRKFKLENGRTLTPNDTNIEIAKNKAVTIEHIRFDKPNVIINDEMVNFNSKKDWEKKINMFLEAEAELMNFDSLKLSFTKSKNDSRETNRNFSYNYTKVSKMHLKLEIKDLKPTVNFVSEVTNAVNSKDREKLREINKKFGSFVPTSITLGGIVYYVIEGESNIFSEQNTTDVSPRIGASGISAVNFNVGAGFNNSESNNEATNIERKYSSLIGGRIQNLENFDKEKWVNSLYDYNTWSCIGFQEPINIFELLDLKLRKKTYEVLGKKILYRDVITFNRQIEYGEREIVNLPLQGKICETIKKGEADCNVFATIVGDEKNDFYNCQIYHPYQSRENNEKPKLIIHCYQKNQKYQPRRKLKIGFMIIGNDFDFSNEENDDMRLEVHYKDHQNLENEIARFNLDKNSFLGIPVLNELNDSDKSILIGHYFVKEGNTIKATMFSYNLEEQKYVNLPRFRFQVLVSKSKTYESVHFRERFMRFMRPRRYIEIEEKVKNIENTLYASIHSLHCGPVFLKQKNNEIKLKYADCKCKRTCSFCKKKSPENGIRCAYFVSNPSNNY
ncbi:hypothetical protein RclHR1_01200010 [Rhizophagus clarus]|uniref:Uncharacterized protein n=1 Tax=Rhizophagus clarus TaxID=94130 RepID=A0A2Z6QYV1_9GLOM|nr:hypothetical protein RclHR1_01200010 [Rhizophagus clarus]GES90201.1 hypothetical protein GLOIN_2v1727896 [Rhizophagus clarus]